LGEEEGVKRRTVGMVVKGKLYGKRGMEKQRKRKNWTDEKITV
jgi:hypothetical protein